MFRTEEIQNADAAFFCGTAAEVIGWESLDGIPLKKKWSTSIGRIIQEKYKDRVIERGFSHIVAKTHVDASQIVAIDTAH